MSATVSLKVIAGPLRGAEFVYRRPALCTIGRSHDCSLPVPNDDPYRTVSRHHCLLEIDPPLARVCDLGSRNGTFVNGEPIGQREHGVGPDPFGALGNPDHALSDGDELRVGDIVFRVGTHVEPLGGEEAPSELVAQGA
jgi:pSer/pThr/pTyr-binding forkhead associated (FHA) protein